MKDSTRAWWHPLTWFGAIWEVFTSVIGGILRLFGIEMPTPRPQHENLMPEDVDRAYNDAAAAEALPHSFEPTDQRVHEFIRYVNSTVEERAVFDLQDFSPEQQDFMIGLTEDDVVELRRRGPVGQIQAALLGRLPAGWEMQAAPEAMPPEPSKAELVRERFLAAVRGLPQDATETCGLDFAPGR
ncbi:hypothetical protein E0H39_29530 [Rhizobium leguminosarum bv. viciae]|uniref:hypothetical protein n=1 Tax=Rhizobium leguminosarum TaxID=384 RepID=UPI00103CEFA6|nr:hypothetical protein [Rhizobium leguminosarum]TBY57961.1 hypothetical protein E0H39_29530 [Rhizobium leguminosarum bv. viciae]